jgi:SecD/SecF fusion protein
MNTKNLPMKFTILGLVIAVCLWLVLTTEPKKGIDLKGGHSLSFELYTKDTDPKDVAEKTIAVLKERIDPQGLRSLDFRPLSRSRIEIRMPAGTQESQDAKLGYSRAMEKLEKSNLKRSSIQRVLNASPANRDKEISNLAGSDKQLADQLRGLVKAHGAMGEAQTDLSSATEALKTAPPERIKELQDKRDKAKRDLSQARRDYDKCEEALLAGNVGTPRLLAVLRNYMSPEEQEKVKNKADVTERQAIYETQLTELRDKFRARVDLINEVVQAYEKWCNVRQQLDDPADLKRLIAKAGVLEFRIAPFSPESNEEFRISSEKRDQFVRILQEEGPEALRKRGEGFGWFPIRGERAGYGSLIVHDYVDGRSYMLLYDQPGYQLVRGTRPEDSWRLDDAYAGADQYNRPAVDFKFDSRGARLFSGLTSNHIDHAMAILLDDEVYSAPNIRSAISERGQITGKFTRAEVADLVRTLQAGSLPARLNPNPIAESTFGPGMGEENLRLAIKVGAWSLLAVTAFMIVYYHIPGVIAVVAMLVNTLLVVGAMYILKATFTLPGIAGVILGLGMAVDANVLIYERLREEQAKGQSIRMALKNAYERAFSAIFDSNITTLLTCLILAWVGTEEIRGFAITLGLGVVFNLFTAVTMTRWIFQFLLESRVVTKPLSMFHLIKTPKFDWMAKRYYFYGLSIALGVLGVAALFAQGGNIWGIEFSSGTRAVVKFKDDALLPDPGSPGKTVLPNDGVVRTLFDEKARQGGYEKLRSTASVTTVLDSERVRNFLRDHDPDQDGKITRQEWLDRKGNKDFFDTLDKLGNGGGVLSAELLERYLPSNAYEISTTEYNVPVIREVATQAFGQAMVQRQRVDFVLVKGERQENLKINLSADGATKIDQALLDAVDPSYRYQFLDYEREGGALFVVRLPKTPITTTELVQRIREMRLQPDFATYALNPFDVIGLVPVGEDSYSEVAVLVKPAEVLSADPRAWSTFMAGEGKLMEEALHREEAMVATNFDPAIAGETAQSAVMALILAWIAMVAYLWVRFGSAQWGLAAVITLVHDAIIMCGMVGLSDWLHRTAVGRWLMVDSFRMDLMMVTAILTMVGYSVNDTIVVFDRIRENRGKLTTISSSLINSSINQTLSRTLLTSSAVVLVLIIMYIWGGPGVHPFSYAMLIGVIEGTYSSIAVSAPLLMGFKQALVSRAVGAPVTTEP